MSVNPSTNTVYLIGSTVLALSGADNSLTLISGASGGCGAINSVTNKVYLCANSGLTVIDGTNNTTSTITLGTLSPVAVAVNPVTNRIYVTDSLTKLLTIVDGSNNSFTNVLLDAQGGVLAVNPVTNKAYVVTQNGTLYVIDGANNATAVGSLGVLPISIAVNPVTNKVYVASQNGNNVTVVDGATNQTATVAAGTRPYGIAVDTAANTIYVVNQGSNDVTVINGTDNSTVTLAVGSGPLHVAVNPLTNRVYAASANSLAVIDGSIYRQTMIQFDTSSDLVATNPATKKTYVASDIGRIRVIDENNVPTTVLTDGVGQNGVVVNPVTNKIYVSSSSSDFLTVMDGSDNSLVYVFLGFGSFAVGVNPVTNKIYVAGASSITEIDGSSNALLATIATGNQPYAIAINPVTNKIYVPNYQDNSVTVINGADHHTETVAVGRQPDAIAVNPVTNKIYVANCIDDSITVIDGTDNSTVPITMAQGCPKAVVVNPLNNKIYVANQGVPGTVVVIDGNNNSHVTVPAHDNPNSVDIDLATNKIYVANKASNDVTVIDGVTNFSRNLALGTGAGVVAVNAANQRAYVASLDLNVVVIDPGTASPVPLTTAITLPPSNPPAVETVVPLFNFAPSSTFSPIAPPPQNVFFQVDTWQGPWTLATPGTPFVGQTAALLPGTHIVYAFATDGQDATSTNGAPAWAPVVGAVSSYVVTIAGAVDTPPQGALENAAGPGGITTLPQGLPLDVTGWAADAEDGAPVNRVLVTVDGTVVGAATLGLSRPDIATRFNNPAWTNSGWEFSYVIPQSLQPGTHTVAAVIYDSLGVSAALPGPSFAVSRNNLPIGVLDKAGNQVNTSNQILSGNVLSARGWAADLDDGAPVTRVEVRVDGVAVGDATLGYSRADIASIYSRPDFLDSGWRFSGVVAFSGPGDHTVDAVAYDSVGTSTVLGTRTVTVPTNHAPMGFVDVAAGQTGTSTIVSGSLMNVRGWAADQEDGAPITRVQVRVDGSGVGDATLGFSRPDVATVYGIAGWTNSGWRFNGPVTLAPGSHSVDAIAYDATGLTTVLTKPQTITINVQNPPVGFVDAAVAPDGSSNLPAGSVLNVRGWAADNEDGSPVAQVDVRIDGVVVGSATTGYARPDVASAYGKPAWTNSGWRFSVTPTLTSGTHVVDAVAHDSSGATTTLAKPKTITVP